MEPEYRVAFPTLWVVPDWIEQHCPVPDGTERGRPFHMYDWQLWCTANHYRIKPTAEVGQRAAAFFNRRSQVVGPQKVGKGPWAATIISNEGVGPALFGGFAGKDDGYACSDFGCGCGWEYAYEPGEPMGIPWVTPLIQLLATSEDQTDNTYKPLMSMVKLGPLGDLMRVTEDFTRLPNDGLIEVVTASATSRLGNPVTFSLHDETGLYTRRNGLVKVAQTVRRGAAGMGGRTMETTNPWDPAEDSTAQQTYESKRPDIFRFYREPPKHLSYKNKQERRKIHAFAYAGTTHVELDSIEAEAAELLETDPGQAERFFGNRVVAGQGVWMDPVLWDSLILREFPGAGERITIGFDGSTGTDRLDYMADATALVGCRLSDGLLFPLGVWEAPGPGPWRPPRPGVRAAVKAAFARFNVVRMYADPPGWQTEVSEWQNEHGADVVVEWWTNRDVPMSSAAERLRTDVLNSRARHTGDARLSEHIKNTRTITKQTTQDLNGNRTRVLLCKESQSSPLKIDAAVTAVLAYEARGDALAAGESVIVEPEKTYAELYYR